MFANRILAKEPLNYFGDPLQDFTQMRFLDKFVFRNPKKLDTTKDSKFYAFASLGKKVIFGFEYKNSITQQVKELPNLIALVMSILPKSDKDIFRCKSFV